MVWEGLMYVVWFLSFFRIMLRNWHFLSMYILVCHTRWQVKNGVTLRLEINKEITISENENRQISFLTCLYYLFSCRELVSQINKQGYGNIFTVLFTLTKPITIAYFHCPCTLWEQILYYGI